MSAAALRIADDPRRAEQRAQLGARVMVGMASPAELRAEIKRVTFEHVRDRNHAVRRYIAEYCAGARSRRAAINQFLDAIEDYERGAYLSSDRYLAGAPSDERLALLWRALKSGKRIPRTVQGIERLL